MAQSTGRFSILAYQPGNPLFPSLPDPNASPTGWSRIQYAGVAGATPKRRSKRPRTDSAGPSILPGGNDSYAGWYLNQIWLRPQPVDFGNIAGQRVRAMSVFHTLRTPIEMTSIDLSAVQPGVELEGVTLPRLLRPFTEITFDAIADVQGLAQFDALVPFTFEDAEAVFPFIEALSPNNADDGTAGQSVTVTGENFTADTVGRFDEAVRDTTFVSATELTVELEAGDLDEPGAYYIRAVDPNRGQSNAKQFLVNYLAPTISDVTASAPDMDGDVTLTVAGTNFYDGETVIRYNGANLSTSFVSATEVTAVLPADDAQDTGAISITAFTPEPGGGTSGAFSLPTPTLSAIDPDEVDQGSPSFTMSVTGTDFFPHAVVRVDGNDRDTTYLSETELEATILDADVSSPGGATITVANPTPGGGESGGESLAILQVFVFTSIGDEAPVIQGNDIEMYGGGGGSGSHGTNAGANVDLSAFGQKYGDTIEVDFDRTWGVSFFDDDFSDSEFYLAIYFETALGSIGYGTSSWEYDQPDRYPSGNGVGLILNHRRSYDLNPRFGAIADEDNGVRNNGTMTEINAGDSSEETGTVHCRHVFEAQNWGQIKASMYIDGVLRYQQTYSHEAWFNMTPTATAACLLHYHRYSTSSLGVDVDDFEFSFVPGAGGGGTDFDSMVLAHSPEAYWKLDETGSATTAADASGNGNNGTYSGSHTLEAPAINRTGGPSVEFDGGTVSTTYSGITGTGARSIGFWVRTDPNFHQDEAFLGYGDDTPDGSKVVIRSDSGRPRYEVAGGYKIFDAQINDGGPHFLVFTYPGGAGTVSDVRCWVDGIEAGEDQLNNQTHDTGTALDVLIGDDPNTSRPMAGWLDRVFFIPSALSEAQIQALYAEGIGAT